MIIFCTATQKNYRVRDGMLYDMETCSHCEGSGQVFIEVFEGLNPVEYNRQCDHCYGHGINEEEI